MVQRNTLQQFGPIVLLAILIVGLTAKVHQLAFLQIEGRHNLDLSKNWEVCLNPKNNCEPYRVHLPDNRQEPYRGQVKDVIEYRNTFITPLQCKALNSNGCVLFIGGVYQGIEAFLNNRSLGQQFTKADVSPATFLLPKSLLEDSHKNEIKILIYTTSPIHRPAIIQGPVGILQLEDSLVFSAGIVGERIVLPIVGAAINLEPIPKPRFYLG